MGLVRDPLAVLRRRLGRRTRVEAIVRAWWAEQGLAELPGAAGKRIALALLEQRARSAKLAGIYVLEELLGDQLRASDLVLFARLELGDRALDDAFATKVLGQMLARDAGRAEVLSALVTWRDGATTTQRRAACLALATLAARGDAVPGVTDAVLLVCATVVWSVHRDDQSAVALVLRELSRAEPVCVEAFFRRYARFMSRACARTAVAKLSPSLRTELLAHHRRATTLRG